MLATLIADNYAAVAANYDAHAEPQRRAAADLLAFTGPVAPRAVLEPGCGTGLYTRLLLAEFPRAEVLGVDISAAMLQVARQKLADSRAEFRIADAEAFHDGQYDLITSNAALQWFNDLPAGLDCLAGLLAPGGTLSFSFFGPETYRELDVALRAVFGGEVRVACRRFADRTELSNLLHAVFPRPEIEERRYTQTFPSLPALLRSIRYTGTRGSPCGPAVSWTPGRLALVERAYCERNGKIQASYQVLFCKGQQA
jgi:malonyl-CoA O-methyltransferase